MSDLLEYLNERQREAVLETEGYVRVIAGAGSGKTKLLVSRYAYLVQDYGIDSSNILCVTFTNKAAGEMKKRIRALIGDQNDTSLICTYHGFCNRLLRENPEKLFLDKQFQIIDSQQQKAVLGEIYQKFDLKLDYASFESILKKIAYAKRDMDYVTKICNPAPCQILGEIKDQDDQIIEEFLQRQKATYSLDFHDLISFAIYLLETDATVRGKWQNRLNYIMVDEFQDSSAVEMRLVDLLSGLFQNLMIVGDPDQNIYEWRGSNVKLLVDFDKGHSPTKTIILNQNYRSTPQILNCANHLIEKNELRLKKDLFTKNAPGAAVVHYHSKNDFDEMDRVVENIKRLHEQEGLKYSDIAVLYRSGFLSRVAEKKLVEKNIPYEIFGGVRFYQRMEILDVLAYLKLIAYDDDASFRRIINTPRRRFGRAKMNFLERLRDEGGSGGKNSLFATLCRHLNEPEFLNSDAVAFVRFVEEIRENTGKKRISDIVNKVTETSGYEAYIRGLGDEERLDNLAEFKRIANEFEREFGENLSLFQFLQQVALQSGEDVDEAKDTVKLMTIHSSKGLEFPAVFILGFTEGIFPSAKTIGERKRLGLEEERRLCYVAITRAEKYLFLMDSEGTSQNGIKKLVSRFLTEIGEENYVRFGQIPEELQKESNRYAEKLNSGFEADEETGSREVGDTVKHHIFGKGIIEAVDEKRGNYLVKFDGLKQARNISVNYFAKKHEDARQKKYEGIGQNGDEDKTKTEMADITPMLPKKADITPELPKRTDITPRLPKKADTVQTIGNTNTGAKPEPKKMKDAAQKPEKTNDIMQTMEKTYTVQKPEKPENTMQLIETPDTLPNPKEAGISVQTAGKANPTPELKEPSRIPQTQPETKLPSGTERRKTAEFLQNAIKSAVEQELAKVTKAAKALEQEIVSTFSTTATPTANTAANAPKKIEITNAANATKKDAPPLPGQEKISAAQAARLKTLKENSPNLWKRDDVPHTGWTCTGISDLGAPTGICEMCGYQIIRYAHHMEHPQYRNLIAGCVCAGKMEGDIAGAKQREAEFKNRQARRLNFFKRKWKQSKKGNEYLKIDGHVVVLYHNTNIGNQWKYAIDNQFCQNTYATRERALAGAFDALEIILKK